MATETTLKDLYTFDATNGTIDPADYAVVEAIVNSDVCSALGVEGTVEPATPMGRMVEWLSLYFTRVLGLNVQNANQMLVSAAAGQQLDAMAQWFQLARRPSTYSTVTVRCFGVAGNTNTVTIPQGSTVRNTDGFVFESTEEATIPAASSDESVPYVDVPFEAIDKGAVDVSTDSVNILDSAITGWDSCNNMEKGVLGSGLETDESLRDRILAARTVAPGFLGAIKNAVEKVVGSGSSMAIENNTGARLDVHGVDMEPHSILVCVDGLEKPTVADYANDEKVQAVAKAIFDNKPCGTGYTKASTIPAYGSTAAARNQYQYEVPVKDPYGNDYNVYFCAPIPQEVTVAIQVQKRNYTGADLLGDVKKAVREWADETNFKCGESVYSSDVIKAVEEKVPGVIVIDCTVSDGGTDKGTAFLEIDAIHKAEISNIYPTQYSR